MSTERRKKN